MKYIYVTVTVPASVIIPIAIGSVKKVYRNYQLKIIFCYLIFAGVIDIVERVLGIQRINNLPILHIYTIIEFVLVIVYFKYIFRDKLFFKLANLVISAFSIMAVLNFLFIQSIYQINSYPRSIAAVIIIVFCATYFLRQSKLETEVSWTQISSNWIVSGMLIYFCSSLFYFAFLNLINDTASDKMYYVILSVHATLVLIMYLLFARGFWVYQHER